MSGATHQARCVLLAAMITLGAGAHANHLLAQATPRSPASSDACGLLTREDAAAALGEAVTDSHVTPNVSDAGTIASACEYAGSGLHRINLSLMRIPAAQVSMYREMCAQQKQDGLAGMGDVACWYQDKHEELHVMKGSAFISIELSRNGDPTVAIKGAMTKALGRLR
jgi:hypothetical protein